LEIDDSGARDRDQTMALWKPAGGSAQHAGMFHGGNPDFSSRLQSLSEVMHDHVIGFRGAGSPYDVQGMAAEKGSQSFAGI
jgi:hypothetical protein